MFDRLEEKDPQHFAVRQYKKYKLAAGETAAKIIYHRVDAEKDFMGLMTFSREQPTLHKLWRKHRQNKKDKAKTLSSVEKDYL